MTTTDLWIQNETIVKNVIFEFISLYGPSNTWNDEIVKTMNEEVYRRIKEQE